MAQLVNYMLRKHEDLSSDPKHLRKELGMELSACGPKAREAETEGCLEFSCLPV